MNSCLTRKNVQKSNFHPIATRFRHLWLTSTIQQNMCRGVPFIHIYEMFLMWLHTGRDIYVGYGIDAAWQGDMSLLIKRIFLYTSTCPPGIYIQIMKTVILKGVPQHKMALCLYCKPLKRGGAIWEDMRFQRKIYYQRKGITSAIGLRFTIWVFKTFLCELIDIYRKWKYGE